MTFLKWSLIPLLTWVLVQSVARADFALPDANDEVPQSRASILDAKLAAAKIAWEKTLADRAAAAKVEAERVAAEKLASQARSLAETKNSSK